MVSTILEEIEEIDDSKTENINYTHDMLKNLPENISLYKCHKCKTIFDIFTNMGAGVAILIALSYRDKIVCPECKSDTTELMCKVDGLSIYLKLKGLKCRENTLMAGTDICPVCNSPMCFICFNHNCLALSRVTGYVQSIDGWNAAKKQELEDRKRYDIR